MKSNSDILIAFILLIGYSYTLITAHILLARADKKLNIFENFSLETGLKDVKAAVTGFSHCAPCVKKAVVLLKLNNYIVYAFWVLLIYSMLFETNH
jgi:hypothetical protein